MPNTPASVRQGITVAFALLCWVLLKFVLPRMEETFKARVDAMWDELGL